MATAFYGTVTIRNLDGTVQSDRFDSTDVDKAFVTFASTGGATFIDVQKNGHIIDVVTNIVAAGDTKDLSLRLNQRETGIRWCQVASFPTTDNRFFNLAPIPVAAGSRIQIQALT